MSVGPDYFAALNPDFLLQIATSLLTYAPQQVSAPVSAASLSFVYHTSGDTSVCISGFSNITHVILSFAGNLLVGRKS